MVPDCTRTLALATSVENGIGVTPSEASEPPVQKFTSPFIGKTVDEVACYFPKTWHFAVLDKSSIDHHTALLVERDLQDATRPVQTVRATFDQVEIQLMALDVATIGFWEVQRDADAAGGVYRTPPLPARSGQPTNTPRKRLESNKGKT